MSTSQKIGLGEVEQLVAPLRAEVSNPIELPEPTHRLDLESRAGDATRQFKHIHQTSMLHVENYRRANQIKLVALLEGFILVARSESSLGQYLFARSILELSAFLYDVTLRLQRAADKPDAAWKSKGEEFFSLVVRARFATTDQTKKSALEAAGLSSKMLKPLNVMNSLAELARDPKHGQIVSHYEKFCDFVHHNSSSQFASSLGFRIGDRAESHGGGSLVMKNSGPIACYMYPLPSKAKTASSETVPVVFKAATLAVEMINAMPSSPFSRAQLMALTGSEIGILQI